MKAFYYTMITCCVVLVLFLSYAMLVQKDLFGFVSILILDIFCTLAFTVFVTWLIEDEYPVFGMKINFKIKNFLKFKHRCKYRIEDVCDQDPKCVKCGKLLSQQKPGYLWD